MNFPTSPEEAFWSAINVWTSKPNVLNRRVCGVVNISCYVVKDTWQNIKSAIDTDCHKYRNVLDICRQLEEHLTTRRIQHQEQTVSMANDLLLLHQQFQNSCVIIVQDLLPKQPDKFHALRQIVICDLQNSATVVLPCWQLNEKRFGIKHCSEDTYVIKLQFSVIHVEMLDKAVSNNDTFSNGLSSCLDHVDDATDLNGASQLLVSSTIDISKQSLICTKAWLTTKLVDKLNAWSKSPQQTSKASLGLVSLERYSQLYSEMKSEHGERLVKNWPETTDPQKFVHEDVAIASYLITFWEQERVDKQLSKKQTFVDLGCGNGLLVHLLAQYGYNGIGIDVRKRKIWDFYGEGTTLKEAAITPSDSDLFPDTDWLLGNHSDELTPWIPVMAARSSYNCGYFVLPCCAHDFHGRFNDRSYGTSLYASYLNYIELLGDKCGFTVQRDTMRIPSTKRVCFIGSNRTYPQSEQQTRNEEIRHFINHRLIRQQQNQQNLGTTIGVDEDTGEHHDSHPDATQSWSSGFEARSSHERVRNCTKLPSNLINNIVTKVMTAILDLGTEAELISLSDGRQWNSGGKLVLSEAVKLFDQETLRQLKSECGGLQTVLRNNHQMFIVQGGCVRLRNPLSSENVGMKRKSTQNKKHKNKQKTTHNTRVTGVDKLEQEKVPINNESINNDVPFPEEKSAHHKTQMCMFQKLHPHGCVFVMDSMCNYKHTAEL